MKNIQSTLRTAPDLCKNISLCRLVETVIHIESVRSEICVYIYTHTHILRTIETPVGQKKQKFGTAVKAECHFGHPCHWLVTHTLDRTLRRRRFERSYGNVIRQAMEFMNNV